MIPVNQLIQGLAITCYLKRNTYNENMPEREGNKPSVDTTHEATQLTRRGLFRLVTRGTLFTAGRPLGTTAIRTSVPTTFGRPSPETAKAIIEAIMK